MLMTSNKEEYKSDSCGGNNYQCSSIFCHISLSVYLCVRRTPRRTSTCSSRSLRTAAKRTLHGLRSTWLGFMWVHRVPVWICILRLQSVMHFHVVYHFIFHLFCIMQYKDKMAALLLFAQTVENLQHPECTYKLNYQRDDVQGERGGETQVRVMSRRKTREQGRSWYAGKSTWTSAGGTEVIQGRFVEKGLLGKNTGGKQSKRQHKTPKNATNQNLGL